MEINRTSVTTYYSVTHNNDEYTVIEMYDDNSDSTTYEIININTDEQLGYDDLFNEIVNAISISKQ